MATQRGNGSYLATHFGTGFAVDAEIKDNRSNFDAFDIGPVATLAVGRARGDRWRFELEAALRRNAAEVVDFNPEIGEDRATGTVRATSLMTNAIYRFYPQSAIAPFAGVGAGLVWADYDVKVLGSTFVDDDDTALGAQAIFGVDITLSPRLTFSADYRLWYASGIKMRQPDGRRLKTNHQVHSVMAGLRYSFATAR